MLVATLEILVAAYKIFSLWRVGSGSRDLADWGLVAQLEGRFPTTILSGKSLFLYCCFHLYQYQLTDPFFSLSNLCSFLYMYSVQLPLNMGHLILTGTL